MKCSKCLMKMAETFSDVTCRWCLHGESAPAYNSCPQPSDFILCMPKLTPHQQIISDQLKVITQTSSVLVNAVCGAGKTEICLDLLAESLKKGMRVAWAVPRREVVLELQVRLSKYFPKLRVVPVCGGHLESVIGDITVCTTHQMHRYYQCFDLLILDEPDAFPFAGNQLLENMVRLSCLGPIVYLSATYNLEHIPSLYLPSRPSAENLPVPSVVCSFLPCFKLIFYIFKLKRESLLLFVATKKQAKIFATCLQCLYITSESDDKDQVIQHFRKYGGVLITTTILERGITFLDCHVLVYDAHHPIFTESCLVQIAGRAMRGMKPQKRNVIFIAKEFTKAMKDCVSRIEKANCDAQRALKLSL